MKKILIRVLAAIGLVPVGRYAALKLSADESNRGLREWKKRADKMGARAKEFERALKKQVQLTKSGRDVSDRQNSELTSMQTRLSEAERALTVAREQLMAIEVKLDILEGAANVLDARTRTAPQRQPGPGVTV